MQFTHACRRRDFRDQRCNSFAVYTVSMLWKRAEKESEREFDDNGRKIIITECIFELNKKSSACASLCFVSVKRIVSFLLAIYKESHQLQSHSPHSMKNFPFIELCCVFSSQSMFSDVELVWHHLSQRFLTTFYSILCYTHTIQYGVQYSCVRKYVSVHHRVRNSSFVDTKAHRLDSGLWIVCSAMYSVHGGASRHQCCRRRRRRRRRSRHCYHCLRLLSILTSAGSSHLFCIQHLYFTLANMPHWLYVCNVTSTLGFIHNNIIALLLLFVIVSLPRSNILCIVHTYMYVYMQYINVQIHNELT